MKMVTSEVRVRPIKLKSRNLRAYLTFVIIVLVFTSILTVDFKSLYAQTQEETNLFNTLKGRYQDGQADPKVKDIIDSFDAEQTKTCPHGHTNGATIKYSAKLVTWASPPARASSAGWMTFKASYVQLGPPKIVKVELEVMFNLAKVKPREDSGDKFDQILNDGLFYHEMLHGWLAVHGKMRDKDWCKEFCECKKHFKMGTETEHHTEIWPWEFSYIKNLATAANYNVVDKKVDSQAQGDGSFSIPTSIDKSTTVGDRIIRWKKWYFNEWLINVDPGTLKLEWDSTKNHIVVKGKLINKTKPGHVKILIDPPEIFGMITSDIYPSSPVGGIAIPVDKPATLFGPYIGLVSAIIIATVATAIYVKHVKRRKKKQ